MRTKENPMTHEQIAILSTFYKLSDVQKNEIADEIKAHLDKGQRLIIKDGQDHGLLLKPEERGVCPRCHGTGRA